MNANLLEVKELVKKYGDRCAVDNLSFSVNKGDILGFLGPNGAGKSTTIRLITRNEDTDAGEIFFDGRKCEGNSTWMKKRIGIVPQDIAYYNDQTAYDNVKFFCSLYGYKGSELSRRVKEALESVGLWDRKGERPGAFSGGMKRRLNIACSIAHTPELLIMDEPTVGIDPQSRNYILQTIKRLNQDGTTVIYVSHYMEEIDAICNRILIADHGKLLIDKTLNELKAEFSENGSKSLEDIFLSMTGVQLRDKEE